VPTALDLLAPSAVWEAWDPDLHPRGAGGRFSARLSYGPNERYIGQRGAGAFVHNRRSAAVARARWNALVDKAHEIHATYWRHQMGMPLSMHHKSLIEYASPTKRADAKARTGDVVMPPHEALRRQMSLVRAGRTPRAGTKRRFSGKATAVRGEGPEYTNAAGQPKPSDRVRNLAGKKPPGGTGRLRRRQPR
jgi:hypothetical protein